MYFSLEWSDAPRGSLSLSICALENIYIRVCIRVCIELCIKIHIERFFAEARCVCVRSLHSTLYTARRSDIAAAQHSATQLGLCCDVGGESERIPWPPPRGPRPTSRALAQHIHIQQIHNRTRGICNTARECVPDRFFFSSFYLRERERLVEESVVLEREDWPFHPRSHTTAAFLSIAPCSGF